MQPAYVCALLPLRLSRPLRPTREKELRRAVVRASTHPRVRSPALPADEERVTNAVRELEWKTTLKEGSVIEVWSQGELRFGYVTGGYEKGVMAAFVDVASATCALSVTTKVSFGEIITVWPDALCKPGANGPALLARDVDTGLNYLKHCRPRSLDLGRIYDDLSRFGKNDERGSRTSFQLAPDLFPMTTVGSRDRNAPIAVATAILLAADTIRFKRAAAGAGWRALPASVVVSRGRCSFVDSCKSILEHRSSSSMSRKRMRAWTREQLELLRELEICAASGTAAHGTSATALVALGYDPTDDGAAKLLLDIEYWATGTLERDGGGTTQATDSEVRPIADKSNVNTSGVTFGKSAGHVDPRSESTKAAKGDVARSNSGNSQRGQSVRDWTFPPEILAEARELRTSARQRRTKLFDARPSNSSRPRRNLLWSPDGREPLAVYCIDDKSSKFLDDAMSVEVLEDGQLIRIAVHITDVDETVRSGSAMDDLAKERGQSLYLPLKPLHMLPAAAMDAASFSSTYPSEAITVTADFDTVLNEIRKWEVEASIVPPVKRLNFDQFDLAMAKGATAAHIDESTCADLRQIASIAPLLAEKLDRRRTKRRQKRGGIRLADGGDRSEKGIAAVRLVRRQDRGYSKGTSRVAQVVDFQSTGSHAAVGDVLTSVGALIRQFARENRVHLPEDRSAASYAARCGTAPMRRYADLAIQRQVKCVLFGRQPAGRRRMDELRIWLVKRQAAGEKTLTERRRKALFDSLANHCAHQCTAASLPYALLNGQVRNLSVTKRGVICVDVSLDSTGLSTTAEISAELFEKVKVSRTPIADALQRPAEGADGAMTGTGMHSGSNAITKQRGSAKQDAEALLVSARQILPARARVRVEIGTVDTVAQKISAKIVSVI